MNNNIKKSFRTGLLLAASIAAISSCTETWDDHYNATALLNYDGTTLQAIKEKAPEFAKVIKAYGYERELGSDNVYTVWAPTNFDASLYVDANGNMIADSADVVKEIIKNHVARYAYSFKQEDASVNLINEKRANITADGKFGGIQMNQTNISCKNGILHLIESTVPYNFNLFELIGKAYRDDTTEGKDTLSLYQFLYDPTVNSDSLIEDKSVSSGVDENGDKIWVDSFVMRNNTILKNVDAKLYEEDSSFIAIIPTAKAWGERRKIAESLLNFNPVEDSRSAGACDSLKRHYSNMFAMTDLFFNKNANEHWTDSLKSTNYRKNNWINNVYYSKMPKYMPEDKEINDILSKCGPKIDASNGDGYIVDEYPMSIYEQFYKRIKVNAYNAIDQTTDSKGNAAYTKNVNTNFRRYSGTYAAYSYNEDSTEVSRKDVDYSFVDIVPSNQSSNISIAFKVPNTLSGEYDMYLISCPIWMTQENRLAQRWDERPYRFYTYVIERNNTGKELGLYPASGERIPNPDGSGNYFVTKGLQYDEEGYPIVNDTTYLGSYTFKNAYYGRNEEGVLIQFQSQVTSKLATTYSREMLVSSIVLKPHDSSKDPIVIPPTEAKAIKNNNKSLITKKD